MDLGKLVMNLSIGAGFIGLNLIYGCSPKLPKENPKQKYHSSMNLPPPELSSFKFETLWEYAVVIKEGGNLVRSNIISLEKPTYALIVRGHNTTYFLTIKEHESRPLEALELAIEKGTYVKILPAAIKRLDQDGIGVIYSDEIFIDRQPKPKKEIIKPLYHKNKV